ncbi:MAG: sodium:calcium antiporter, partial [Dehalococcoidia bacterium]|nr:sodium:calcium antiporter [Dehalococcoidia bacterium]
LGVLGGAAAASPIAVSQDLYAFELPVLAVSALILVPLMWRRAHIGRIEGVLLLIGFVAFTALTLIRGGS